MSDPNPIPDPPPGGAPVYPVVPMPDPPTEFPPPPAPGRMRGADVPMITEVLPPSPIIPPPAVAQP